MDDAGAALASREVAPNWNCFVKFEPRTTLELGLNALRLSQGPLDLHIPGTPSRRWSHATMNQPAPLNPHPGLRFPMYSASTSKQLTEIPPDEYAASECSVVSTETAVLHP